MTKMSTSDLKAMLAAEKANALAAISAAQLETDYVNHVFMQQNPGFMILYSFIKDALLSKVGVVKVWWEEREEESRETYYDLTDDQFALLAQTVAESGGAMKIIEHTVHEPGSKE